MPATVRAWLGEPGPRFFSCSTEILIWMARSENHPAADNSLLRTLSLFRYENRIRRRTADRYRRIYETRSLCAAKHTYSGPTCKCQGGVPNIASCPKDGAELCALCNAGFKVQGSTSRCVKIVTGSCRFDVDAQICGWTESGFKHWTRGTKTRHPWQTGAQRAHSGSYFMFLETSLGGAGGGKGRASYLISPKLSSSTKSMTFFYHMHGKTMGTLSVQVLLAVNVGRFVCPGECRTSTARDCWTSTGWTVTGEQHARYYDPWHATGLNLPTGTSQVRFKGTDGRSWLGDMAVDTVEFSVAAYKTRVCTCANGTAPVGPRCATDKAQICVACNAGFLLQSASKTCINRTIIQPVCRCANGTAVTDCSKINAEGCISCDKGFGLVARQPTGLLAVRPLQARCAALPVEPSVVKPSQARLFLNDTQSFNVPPNLNDSVVDCLQKEAPAGSDPIVTDTSQGKTGAALGDVNNDGWLDLYITYRHARNRLYFNYNGSFVERMNSSAAAANGAHTVRAVFGDVNNDGWIDLFVVNYNRVNQLLINSKQGNFVEQKNSPAMARKDRSTDAVFGDVNKDGWMDLYVGNWDTANDLFLNDRTGNLIKTSSNVAKCSGKCRANTGIAMGDINHDGFLDLFLVNLFGNQLFFYDATLGDFVEHTAGPAVRSRNLCHMAVLEDFNKDGFADLFLIGGRNIKNQLFFYNATQKDFVERMTGPTALDSSTSTSMIAGDVNHDGWIDLFVCNSEMPNKLFINDQQGNFIEQRSGPASRRQAFDSVGAVLGDVDGDGNLDLFVVNGCEGGGTGIGNCNGWTSPGQRNQLFLNVQQNWRFRAEQTNSPTLSRTTKFSIFMGTEMADGTTNAAFGDFDGDGALDLYLARHSETNQLFINDKNGNFYESKSATTAVGGGEETLPSTAAVTGDINNDGWLDIYVTNACKGLCPSNQLFLNDKSGGFVEVMNSATVADNVNSRQASLGDIDRDGDLDLYVVNGGQPNQLFINTNGDLNPRLCGPEVAGSYQSQAAVLVDLNNDEALDLYVVNSLKRNQLFFNDGKGRFVEETHGPAANKTMFRSKGQRQHVAAADVNGDGWLDLYVANEGCRNDLFINDQQGNFYEQTHGPAVSSSGNQQSYGATFGDVNGDGAVDLYVTNRGSNLLFINDNTGNFVEQFGIVTEGSWTSFRAIFGDINGDGALDLYVANQGAHNQLFYNDRCPLGYATDPDQSDFTCYACPSYSTDMLESSARCRLCPGGTVVPKGLIARHDQRFMCTPCAAGKYRPQERRVAECLKCPLGRYSTSGASACRKCAPGYAPNQHRTDCVDIDECRNFTLNGCDELRGIQQKSASCLNAPGYFSCASCPTGFVDNSKASRSQALAIKYACVRRRIDNLTGAAEALPTAKLQMYCDPKALTTREKQEALKALLIADFAAALSRPASDFEIKSFDVASGTSQKQAQQPSAVKVEISVVLNGHNSAGNLKELITQLAEPTSALMSGTATSQLLLGQNPVYSTTCPKGTQPSADGGICQACPGDKYSPDGAICVLCPAGQVAAEDAASCMCKDGYFNRTQGIIKCFESDAEEFDSSEFVRQAQEICVSCANLPCVECTRHGVQVVDGFKMTVAKSTKARAVFQCPLGDTSCIKDACTKGYLGPLCNVCADRYSRVGLAGPCSECFGTMNWPLAIGGAVLALALIMLALNKVGSRHAGSGKVAVYISLGKIATSMAQILTASQAVFNINFPDSFRWLLDLLKFFALDLFGFLRMGCLTGYEYSDKLVMANLLPLVLLSCIMSIYFVRRNAVEDMQDRAVRMGYAAIFLIYAFLSQSMFEAFACRDLGGQQWLAVDYQTSCDDDSYTVLVAFAALGVLVYPIGVPALTYVALYQNRVDLHDHNSAAYSRFSFMLQDYKPEYWYWECVEMLRKAILTGIISVFRRGSLFQLVVGALLSMVFGFASAKCCPYVDQRANVFKIATEASILATLTLAILLKISVADLAKEGLTPDFIGGCMLFETLVVPIGTLVVAFATSALDIHAEVMEATSVDVVSIHKSPIEELQIENPLNRDGGGGDDGTGAGDELRADLDSSS